MPPLNPIQSGRRGNCPPPLRFFILMNKNWFRETPIPLDFSILPIAKILSHFSGQVYLRFSFYGHFRLGESRFYLRKNHRDHFENSVETTINFEKGWGKLLRVLI